MVDRELERIPGRAAAARILNIGAADFGQWAGAADLRAGSRRRRRPADAGRPRHATGGHRSEGQPDQIDHGPAQEARRPEQRGSNVNYFLVRALENGQRKRPTRLSEPVYLAGRCAGGVRTRGAVDAWVVWDPYYAAEIGLGARSSRMPPSLPPTCRSTSPPRHRRGRSKVLTTVLAAIDESTSGSRRQPQAICGRAEPEDRASTEIIERSVNRAELGARQDRACSPSSRRSPTSSPVRLVEGDQRLRCRNRGRRAERRAPVCRPRHARLLGPVDLVGNSRPGSGRASASSSAEAMKRNLAGGGRADAVCSHRSDARRRRRNHQAHAGAWSSSRACARLAASNANAASW